MYTEKFYGPRMHACKQNFGPIHILQTSVYTFLKTKQFIRSIYMKDSAPLDQKYA